MQTFQFINKSYRPFLSKNILLTKFYIDQDPDPVFFQRSDPDPHQNGLDPQIWLSRKQYTWYRFLQYTGKLRMKPNLQYKKKNTIPVR
jgi:hypothetical protein